MYQFLKFIGNLFIVIGLSQMSLAQSIRINEVVASNSIHLDEDGDSPDWLELHNYGTSTVNLSNWTLSDDEDNPQKWAFPNINLTPDSYLFLWASSKDRLETGGTRTLITQGDSFYYHIPTATLPTDWVDLDYDPQNWEEGPSGFGYDDNDDNTIIPTGTLSIYLRKTFELADVNSIKELILDVDYDDAFVAYINGTEIARANINGTFPAYDAGTPTDHEAQLYQGGQADRFIIDDIAELLQDGTNVLAIQALNISNNSSDFTIIPYLSAVYAGFSNEGISPPSELNLSNQYLHTNFKISAEEESLFLYDSMGTLIHQTEINNLPSNISFGYSNTQNGFAYFENTTPGYENDLLSYLGIVNRNIQFSHDGGEVGFFSLGLNGVASDETIRYTKDATVPDENSPIYSIPIPIAENTVIRARVFKDGFIPSKPQSHTYLYNESHSLPIICLVTEPDNFFDNETGIYVKGPGLHPDFPYFEANFWEDWERPIHFSLYEPNGDLGLAFDGGIKIFGGWSRALDQKSLSIFARKRYGLEEINYPLFDRLPYENFQALVLRNSGNDWLRTQFRDGALTSLMQGTSIDFQAYRPTVTYLNGEYWGIHNIREKINEHYFAIKYNLNPDELDILEFNGDVVHGDNQEYRQLINYVSANDLVNDVNYQYVADRIDIENFIIYNITQIYFDNQDWPGNNIKFWRPKDGKWKWVLFDTDYGFGIWSSDAYLNNTLAFALNPDGPFWPNPPWSTLLFRKLTQNQNFQHQFVNRFADEMNSRFISERVCIHIDSVAQKIAPEIARHLNRWGENSASWNFHVENMKRFAQLRPIRQKFHILSAFGLPTFHELTIDIKDTNEGFVKINNRLSIQQNLWTGDYFETVPIQIEAIPASGYRFLHWEGDNFSGSALIDVDMQNPMTLTPVFEKVLDEDIAIIINEINYQSHPDWDTEDWIELYNPNIATIDLSNWLLQNAEENNAFQFPDNTLIKGEDYLLITKSSNQFATLYPNITQLIGDFSFNLSNQGDHIQLFSDDNTLIDEVSYGVIDPWNTTANGQGATLELIAPELDNSLAENWTNVNEKGSPAAPNLPQEEEEIPFNGQVIENWDFFPNPFLNELNIHFCLKQDTHIQAYLYDIQGRKTHDIFIGQLEVGDYFLQEETPDLPEGLYILKFIEGEENVLIRKWLKQ